MSTVFKDAKNLTNISPGTDLAEEMPKKELASFPLPRFCLASSDCDPVSGQLPRPPVQLCPAPFPSQTQSSPWGFGTLSKAQQTSLTKNLNFTAWILRKLYQEPACEADVFNSLYLLNYTAEIKYLCVMAQSFLAQWSMRYISIHWNQ